MGDVDGEVKGGSGGSAEDGTPQEVLAAGGVSKSRRSGSGRSRYGHRRSPTTGHRVRRHKTPEPNFAALKDKTNDPKNGREPKDRENKRSLSSPGEARDPSYKQISSSEEEEVRKPRKLTKSKSESSKTKLVDGKRFSGASVTSVEPSGEEVKSSNRPKPALLARRKSNGQEDKEQHGDKEASWWKSWPSWSQKLRGKSLEREPKLEAQMVAPPRRNRSLERPPVLKEKDKRAAVKKEKDATPVAKKRSKSKTRVVADEEEKTNVNRRPSVEEDSDDFWKPADGVRKRNVEEKVEEVEAVKLTDNQLPNDDSSKQLVLVGAIVKQEEKEPKRKTEGIVKVIKDQKEKFMKFKLIFKEIWSIDFRESYREVRAEWDFFRVTNRKEVVTLRLMRNQCIASLVILVMYCGTGALIFRFTEGAFESFYKCGVKRVKRDFVDSLWHTSHNLREDEWKSQARRKLMEFENQLHTAYEAGMTSYSGLKAWSFLNAFVYCLTVVTTIGYGHISPSTTTGRAITIIYAIFGIPMFLILLADFGKLFTRLIKFLWAFVRRVYYTGSCKRVRRTAHVQSTRSSGDQLESAIGPASSTSEKDSEVMKGVQMVYDIATFRRPSQLPPGVTLDDAPPFPPPRPPGPSSAYTPVTAGEAPGTPALSNFAIDDEFNLPISVAIFILLIYIFCGATVFYFWESWGFFESFYFVFISMSTIGFGDLVPQGLIDPPPDTDSGDKLALISPNQMYMMASIVYLVFGLALTSMCINVVQEKLSDSFRQASAKIGATIGLRVAEEDGTVTPVAPKPVEIAEVHSKTPAVPQDIAS